MATEQMSSIMGSKTAIETESGLLKKNANSGNSNQRTYDPRKTAAFRYHGKLLLYSKKSLFLFDEKSLFRKIVVWIIEWK